MEELMNRRMSTAQPLPFHKGYRRDIDGLRGVAVLAVVLYHLADARVPGGFVGVDIFFVISGYLIAGIVARDIEAGTFTLGAFYERRVRRIVPAFFAMLLVVSAGATYMLLPNDLITYGSSLLAATFSFANYFFWFKGSYFTDTYSWLLLHSWSLSVEEQFYLLFPLSLLLLKRYLRMARPILLIVGALSLAYSTWLVTRDPTAAFYSPFSRAWELLLGCLLGVASLPLPSSRVMREMMATAGILMIFGSIMMYSKYTVFPGAAALVPCLGCGLLLVTGEAGSTAGTKLLSTNPLVGIGRISYSIYLWHWPLIVISRFDVVPGLTSHGPAKLLVLFASIILGYLSWRFVEQPFRSRRNQVRGRRKIFAGAALGAATLTIVAYTVIANHGFPGRFSTRAIAVASWLSKPQQLTEHNVLTMERHLSSWSVDDHTVIDSSRQNYLLVGDSHAAALRPGLVAELKGVNILMAVQANCDPLVNQYENSPCGAMNRYIYEQLLQKHQFAGVILTHRWLSEAEINQLEPTVAWFKERHIKLLIIGPVQEYEAPLPLLLAFALRQGRPNLPQQRLDAKDQGFDRMLQQKTSAWQVPYLSMLQTFCPQGICKEYIDPEHLVPTLYDSGHVTEPAARWVVEQWVQQGMLPADMVSGDPLSRGKAAAPTDAKPD